MSIELNDAIIAAIATIIAAIITILPGLIAQPLPELSYRLRIRFLIFSLLIISLFWIDELPLPIEKKVHLDPCAVGKCCSNHCELLQPEPVADITYREKWWSFSGHLTFDNKQMLKNNYQFSFHNIPYEQAKCLLPIKNPDHFVENYADVVEFETSSNGTATIPFDFDRIKPCDNYVMQARLKNLGGEYKNTMCQCTDHVKINIVNMKMLVVWSILVLLNIALLITFIKEKRR